MARFGFSAGRAVPVLRFGRIHLCGNRSHPRRGSAGRRDHLRHGGRRRAAPARRAGPADCRHGGPHRPRRQSDGPRVSDREVGEVLIRGTSMMSGYLGDTPRAADEWFRTGDLGYLVDDGLVVCGRAKEIITVAGRNIFPAEVEQIAPGARCPRGCRRRGRVGEDHPARPGGHRPSFADPMRRGPHPTDAGGRLRLRVVPPMWCSSNGTLPRTSWASCADSRSSAGSRSAQASRPSSSTDRKRRSLSPQRTSRRSPGPRRRRSPRPRRPADRHRHPLWRRASGR